MTSSSFSIKALEELRSELQHAYARDARTPWWRPADWKAPIAVVASTVVLAGSAAAGVSLLQSGEPIAPAPRGDVPAAQEPLRGEAGIIGATTADPDGGMPWGVKTFRSTGGDHCFVVGQVFNSKVGRLQNGTFRELPLRGPAACSALGGQVPIAMITDYFPAEDRTVVYGKTGPTVSRLDLDDGHTRRIVDVGPNTTYLTVYEGQPDLVRSVYFTDGKIQTLDPKLPVTPPMP